MTFLQQVTAAARRGRYAPVDYRQDYTSKNDPMYWCAKCKRGHDGAREIYGDIPSMGLNRATCYECRGEKPPEPKRTRRRNAPAQ